MLCERLYQAWDEGGSYEGSYMDYTDPNAPGGGYIPGGGVEVGGVGGPDSGPDLSYQYVTADSVTSWGSAGESYTVYADGTMIIGNPDGSTTNVSTGWTTNVDGSMTAMSADGNTVITVNPDGSVTQVNADGSVVDTPPVLDSSGNPARTAYNRVKAAVAAATGGGGGSGVTLGGSGGASKPPAGSVPPTSGGAPASTETVLVLGLVAVVAIVLLMR